MQLCSYIQTIGLHFRVSDPVSYTRRMFAYFIAGVMKFVMKLQNSNVVCMFLYSFDITVPRLQF